MHHFFQVLAQSIEITHSFFEFSLRIALSWCFGSRLDPLLGCFKINGTLTQANVLCWSIHLDLSSLLHSLAVCLLVLLLSLSFLRNHSHLLLA